MTLPFPVVSCSGGNDSLALVQYCKTQDIPCVYVTYINTGWASPSWASRIQLVREWVLSLGYAFVEIPSIGMEQLVKDRAAFPANQYQFCTQHLKGVPFLHWIDKVDPHNRATVLIGKRRAESHARSETAEFVPNSEYHGGRTVWHPLFAHTDAMRDALLADTPFSVLPHRSQECSPCVNANRADFLALQPQDVQKVCELEVALGKPMFRPKRFNALGIYGVMAWAVNGRRKMRTEAADIEQWQGCAGHYGCGL